MRVGCFFENSQSAISYKRVAGATYSDSTSRICIRRRRRGRLESEGEGNPWPIPRTTTGGSEKTDRVPAEAGARRVVVNNDGYHGETLARVVHSAAL